ncbi:MAG: helix-turn-helix domain-containing protein [Lentisphaerae bacterium]|jgi:DNA-binding transcriptional ArsR family regulator|nr:helix-turn-helix domain-containing protein [Lentisphaerota bacterium]MBT4818282.1 helix-turn-helix domain-containing protein [Lentisphaerota bacterium]MBT5612101.1 helix-turn-helix domain-containing protein [Lentisphaerota bacterium]MBT7060563.1 helix-turn-helix domain-containing protein [Lentisphaerota bacterium]MBT7840672.1 helix-turn-helix domain-containing protein [Lentisphaerota bacterium]
MSSEDASLYAQLERIFHEPKRLAIVSSLAGSARGKTFVQLKEECDLTDGNLSRHLKALSDDGIVDQAKAFVGMKPQTTARLTSAGRTRFLQYLDTLEQVLNRAGDALSSAARELEDVAGKAWPIPETA